MSSKRKKKEADGDLSEYEVAPDDEEEEDISSAGSASS